jgi:hypothetical protein
MNPPLLPKGPHRLRWHGVVLRTVLDPRSRTVDQMVQAARSGKQNIVEGSHVSGTSKEAELKLLNVARASAITCEPAGTRFGTRTRTRRCS